LTAKCGGNAHNRGAVEITVRSNPGRARCAVNLEDSKSCFTSQGSPG
jgi:hypothetical protein